MRENETKRGLSLTFATVTAACLLFAATPVLANEDDEPARDDGIVGNIMRGLGATDGSNGINYRERSPLVVPRNLTLPPPEARRPEAANWPKDPDVLERRAQREAIRKRDKAKENDRFESTRIQPEPQLGEARARTATVAPQPGMPDDRRTVEQQNGLLSPSQLGVKAGGLFSNWFGGKKEETMAFTGEPSREALTQPPPGYQTPAANQAYGIPEKERYQPLNSQATNPSGILPPGKF